jgi:hypothetical protein
MQAKERTPVKEHLVDIRYVCAGCGMETKRTVAEEAPWAGAATACGVSARIASGRLWAARRRTASNELDWVQIAAAPGVDREIRRWCESLWAAWSHVHAQIAELCKEKLGLAR